MMTQTPLTRLRHQDSQASGPVHVSLPAVPLHGHNHRLTRPTGSSKTYTGSEPRRTAVRGQKHSTVSYAAAVSAVEHDAAMEPCSTAMFMLGAVLGTIRERHHDPDLDTACQDLCFLSKLTQAVQQSMAAPTPELKHQAEVLRGDLLEALAVLAPGLSAAASSHHPPAKTLLCTLELQRLHLSVSKVLWQCGLGAQEVTAAVDACISVMFPVSDTGQACQSDMQEAEERHPWCVPRAQVDALVLSMTMLDSQHFYEALWELLRTAMLNRQWQLCDILGAVPLVLHSLAQSSCSDSTTASVLPDTDQHTVSHDTTSHPAPQLASPLFFLARTVSAPQLVAPSGPAADLARASEQLFAALSTPQAQQLWRRIHWDTFDVLGWKLRQHMHAQGEGAEGMVHVPELAWTGQGVAADVIGAAGGVQSVPRTFTRSSTTDAPAHSRAALAREQAAPLASVEDMVQSANLPAVAAAYHTVQPQLAAADVTAAQQLLVTAALYNSACQSGLRWEDGYVPSEAWLHAVSSAALPAGSTLPSKRARGRPRRRPPSPGTASVPAQQCFGGSTELLLTLLGAAHSLKGPGSLPESPLTVVDNTLVQRWGEAVAVWGHGSCSAAPESSVPAGSSVGTPADTWLQLVWGWTPSDVAGRDSLGHRVVHDKPAKQRKSTSSAPAPLQDDPTGTAAAAALPLPTVMSLYQVCQGLRKGPVTETLLDLVLRSVRSAADDVAAQAALSLGMVCRLPSDRPGQPGGVEQQATPAVAEAAVLDQALGVLSALQTLITMHLDMTPDPPPGSDPAGTGPTAGTTSTTESVTSNADSLPCAARQTAERLLTKVLVVVALLPGSAWTSVSFLTQTYPSLAQVVCGRMGHSAHELLMARYLDSVMLLMHPPPPEAATQLTADQIHNIVRTARLVPDCVLPDGWHTALDAALHSIITAARVSLFMRPEVWAPLLRAVADAHWACPRASAALLSLAAEHPDMFYGELTLHDVDAVLTGGLWPALAARMSQTEGIVMAAAGRSVRAQGVSGEPRDVTDQHLHQLTVLHAHAAQQVQQQHLQGNTIDFL